MRGREGEGGRGGMDKRWWKVEGDREGARNIREQGLYEESLYNCGNVEENSIDAINSSFGSKEETQKPFPGHSPIITWNTHHTQSHAEGGKGPGHTTDT